MKIQTLLLSIIVTFLIGCNSSNTSSTTQVINITLNKNIIDLPKFDIKPVQLELKNNSYHTLIKQVEIINDNIYILDFQPSEKSISIYSKSGKKLNDMAFKGRGVGEVLLAFSFFETDSTINVLDANSLKMVIYSKNDHSYLSSKDVPFNVTEAIGLDNGQIMWLTISDPMIAKEFQEFCFVITDNKEISPVVGILKELTPLNTIMSLTKPAYKVGDEIHFVDKIRPYIYKLDDGKEVTKIYEMQYGDFRFAPLEFIVKAQENRTYIEEIKESSYINSYSIMETTKAILATFEIKAVKYIAMYDKHSGDSFMTTQEDFNKHIGYEISSFTNPANDSFVGVVENENSNPTLLFIN